jgi:hypothetical protein
MPHPPSSPCVQEPSRELVEEMATFTSQLVFETGKLTEVLQAMEQEGEGEGEDDDEELDPELVALLNQVRRVLCWGF